MNAKVAACSKETPHGLELNLVASKSIKSVKMGGGSPKWRCPPHLGPPHSGQVDLLPEVAIGFCLRAHSNVFRPGWTSMSV